MFLQDAAKYRTVVPVCPLHKIVVISRLARPIATRLQFRHTLLDSDRYFTPGSLHADQPLTEAKKIFSGAKLFLDTLSSSNRSSC